VCGVPEQRKIISKPLKTQKSRKKSKGETQEIGKPQPLWAKTRPFLSTLSHFFDDYRNHKATFFQTSTPSLLQVREGNEKILGGRKAKSLVLESRSAT